MKKGQIKYQVVIVFTLGVYLYYLIYRLLYTINPDALILSISFFYAEVHGFIALFLFFFQLWNPIERKSPPALDGLLVDVYIPTYNEDVSVLKKTALACVNIRYPHKTYILDDGNRSWLAKEAANWGCEYITRTERVHAKAGNLNHALQRTRGDYVVVFDADYVPQSDFLEKTLGYFHDQKVAFVQAPHNYYNVDTFQFKLHMKKEKLWNEQDIFYRLMMSGRDYWNSAFFAGTVAVFRKKALEEIGGFYTKSITEDVQTTVLLYSRGWKGVYHNEILASGLAAKDLKNYHSQLLRWAEGNIGMFFRNNPLFIKGLSLPQRICFFATIFGWLIGFPKLIYFIMPSLMILTGAYPIEPFTGSFAWRYLMFLAVIMLGFKFTTRGYGLIRYAESYTMINFYVLIKAALRNILRVKSTFRVTGKGHEFIGISHILPQGFMCLTCFAAIIWGGLKLFYGITGDFMGTGTAIFWTTINGMIALVTIEGVTRPHFKRREFRFIGTIPVKYSVCAEDDFMKETKDVLKKLATRRDATGKWFYTITGLGISKDLNELGISLITFTPLPVNKKMHLSLYLDERVLDCKATVLYTITSDYTGGKIYHCGVKFEALDEEKTRIISQYCFNTILPRFRYRFGQKPSVFTKMLFRYYKRKHYIRRHKRKGTTLPLTVRWKEKNFLTAVTKDISKSGLSFINSAPLESGTRVAMKVITPFGSLVARGEIKQTREMVAGHSFLMGVQFTKLPVCAKNILSHLSGEGEKREAVRLAVAANCKLPPKKGRRRRVPASVRFPAASFSGGNPVVENP